MALTVTTPAPTRRLTRRENVKREFTTALPTSDDPFFDALIDQASSAIESYCTRPFARQAYTETFAGFGEIEVMLARTPLVAVSSVLYDLSPIVDFVISDANAGFLYRQAGWFWTAQVIAGLVGKQRWPGLGDPLPRQEEPRFTASYVAGWLLPSQDLLAGTVSASVVDNSFSDSAAGFPPMLQAGDIIRTSGFANAANNGAFVVTGTPTPSKILVTATLATEAEGAGKVLQVSNLPGDLEKAAIETVKAWYLDRQKTPHARRERVGDQDLEWTDPVNVVGLPFIVVGLLRPYQRNN